ncbi:hypothetical protein Mpe_B0163 (plasmid) [Methylibium petroleiphilum PM1]|uniref:Uncharacterized protein n=2 Tax=Methylibium TaxID=316612 RepID=A2SN02_METPP|nr:hypothetical protein Mpe_B0163 [Methylibium petroleiphilum PM1]
MMSLLTRLALLAALMVAPTLALADVRPAECVSPGPGTCTEWKVYTAEGATTTDEHAYLSWTPGEWASALASCNGAGGTAVSNGGWLWMNKSTNVSGGLCGRVFAINNLCRSTNAGDGTRLQCAKWGLNEPSRPGWLSVAMDNREGVLACGGVFMAIGGDIAPGVPGFSAAEPPKLAPVTKKSIGKLKESLTSMQEAARATGAKEKARSYYAAYKSYKKAKDQFDDSLENVQKASEFVGMVADVSLEGVISISAIAALPRQANCIRNGTVMSGGCDLRPGDIDQLQRFQQYVNETDAVKCFSAAGKIAAALQRQ